MSRSLHKLTARTSLINPGRYSDGGGLYLVVTEAGTKKWVFIYTRGGKKREMGLGSAGPGGIGLKEVRERAAVARRALQAGNDPIIERDRQQEGSGSIPTFGEAAVRYVDEIAPGFRNKKHLEQWRMTLRVYAKSLWNKLVDAIATEDVLLVLRSIWHSKPETAKRLQGRIERILDAEKALGHRSGENPARWRGHLDKLLAKPKKLTRGHHAALPYEAVPALIAKLRESEGMSARALEFTIYCASRSSEIRLARWDEMDLVEKTWTIPAGRMKAERPHVVPLSAQAIETLERARRLAEQLGRETDGLVFPSSKRGAPLSATSISHALADRVDVHATAHGMRTAFRHFCAKETGATWEVAEDALAHRFANATERAYFRIDLVKERRPLMKAWGAYCVGRKNVVKLVEAVNVGRRNRAAGGRAKA